MQGHTIKKLAWLTIGFVALAQIVQVPTIERSLRSFESTPVGRGAIVSVLVAWGCVAVGLWVAATIYAYERARQTKGPYYPVALLVVSNFVGALIYYFAFVRHHSDEKQNRRFVTPQ